MRASRLTRVAIVAALTIGGSIVGLRTVFADAATTNLISNPGAESAGATAGAPADWTFSAWGKNTVTQSWKSPGRDSQQSLAITMTARTTGDAKWMSAPIPVKAGTRYALTDSYISTVKTSLEAVFTNAAGKETYVWLADVPASASWKQAAASFTAPSGAVRVSVYHILEAKGSLQTDGYELIDTSVAAPPTNPPPATPPTLTISAPADGATDVNGIVQVTATASADTKGVAFKVDGVALGAEDTVLPYAATWDTKTVANGSHEITATARNNTGEVTKKVMVTVNNTQAGNPPPPPPPPQPGNLIANPGTESGMGTAPTSWASSKWGTNTTTFSRPAGHNSSKGVKTDVTKYTSGDANWRPNPVTVTAGKSYRYTAFYQSNVDTEVDVEVTMANGTVQYAFLASAPPSSGWSQISATYTVPAGASKLTVFQPIAKKGWLTVDDVSLTEYTPAKFDKARVSLTFDDAWLSQYTAALPALNSRNMKATYYMLSGSTADPQYMTVNQMKEVKAAGHEIASHTITHPHLPTLTAAQLDTEMRKSQADLRGWMPGDTTARNFCTPFGEYNAAVVTKAKELYRSHRSTDEGFNTKDATDPYNIKVQNILGTTTPAQVKQWVDQAVRDNSWLVLVYHEVGANNAVEDPMYSVTPANLNAELDIIKASGITVATVDQALDAILPQI